MTCPDELTLELWLAGALPADAAAAVANHVQTCAACTAAQQTARAFEAEFHAALALDPDERAYLAGLELASSWRASPVAVVKSWSRIALAGIVAGFVAWLVAGPLFGAAVATATQIGLGTVLLNAAFGVAFNIAQALFELSRNPALGLSQPLLALLALALLVWPPQLIPQRSTPS